MQFRRPTPFFTAAFQSTTRTRLRPAPRLIAVSLAVVACSTPRPDRPRDGSVSIDRPPVTDSTPPTDATTQDSTITDLGPADATTRQKTCGWLEVRAPTDASVTCPSNAEPGPDGDCSCHDGWLAVDCNASPCDGGRCTGDWYCARALHDDGAHCPTWPVAIAETAPTLRCTQQPSGFVSMVVSRLSSLWSSPLRACPCEADARAYGCFHNAFVFFDSPGVIHYDTALVETMATVVGDDIAAALVFGHEVGHSVQATNAKLSGYTIQMELGADCYAGYFLGSLECNGDVDTTGVARAMTAACSWGDRMNIPWWSPEAHGSCQQRTDALMRGLEGYRARRNPALVCRWASGH